MGRFEVEVVLRSSYVFAIAADSAVEAQAIAFASLTEREPDRADVEVKVERGVS